MKDEGRDDGYEKVIETLGMVESEEKPFWAKYLQDGYRPTEPKSILPDVMAVLEGDKTADEFIQKD